MIKLLLYKIGYFKVEDINSSEGIPYFTSNELVKTWTLFDTDLKMFYKFICSPFEVPLHKLAMIKYDKHQKKLNVKLKKTFKGKAPFRYNPSKHNVYYFRSRRMLYTLMVKPNTIHLQNGNPNYLKVFCKVMSSR